MSKFEKLLAKRKEEGKSLSPIAKDAKMNVLKDLHKMASDSIANKLGDYKKVTVAAPDEAGLKKGLDKAKDIVSDMPGMLDDAESGHEDLENKEEELGEDLDGDNEAGEDEEHQEAVLGHDVPPGEHDEMSEDELDAKLAELMQKKSMMQAKKA